MKPKVFKKLEELAALAPAALYWTNADAIIVGLNNPGSKIAGDLSGQEAIGKGPYEMYPPETAAMIFNNTKKVIKSAQTLTFEEPVPDLATGKMRYYTAIRSPLFEKDKVVGIVGTVLEVTAQKEAEQLRLENLLQKTKLEEQEKFRKIIDQIACDIQSPGAVLSVLVEYCSSLEKTQALKQLNEIARTIPFPMYWLDSDQHYIGVNEAAVKITATSSCEKNFLNKTPYDLCPYNMAENTVKHHREAIKAKRMIFAEESLIDFAGKIKCFNAFVSPIYDNNKNIIGTLGISIDITAEKDAARLRLETEMQRVSLQEQEKFKKIVNQVASDIQSPSAILSVLVQYCTGMNAEKMFATLEKLASAIPVPIYWLDIDKVFLGMNKLCLDITGASSTDVFIGKKYDEVYPEDIAEQRKKALDLVLQEDKIIETEEEIRDFSTCKSRYFTAVRSPLHDENGLIVGIAATSIEITERKDAERVKREKDIIESKLQEAKLREEEQEKFKQLARQVAHDINSPLTGLLTFIQSCNELPESKRLTLRQVATRISDVANHLFTAYKKDLEVGYTKQGLMVEKRQPVMVALTLLQLLTEKRYQYKDLSIRFEPIFCAECNSAFILIEPSNFQRMISNLLNNAVDALDKREDGLVRIMLGMDEYEVKIGIDDNGKGMSEEVMDKIVTGTAVTMDKSDGHGIGFMQIRDTVKLNAGRFDIDSKVGKGTRVTLFFPRINTPDWLVRRIEFNKGDTIVILDDDPSIHNAWETRFAPHKDDIRLQHFTFGQDVIDFIGAFEDKDKILLLADYELANQNVTGISVIERGGIKRSLLVTSHYAEPEIQELVRKVGTKLLPKQLAAEIEIISV